MTQIIALQRADGSVAGQHLVPTASTAKAAGDNPDALSEVVVSRIGDLAFEKLVNGAWVADLTKLGPILLAQIDSQREDQRRPVMTQLLGQSHVYSEKAREVADYRSLLSNVLAALTMPQLAARFPFATAEASATGDSLATVITRFEAGGTASRTALARIDALATKAKRGVRAATTEAAMRTAATVNWSA